MNNSKLNWLSYLSTQHFNCFVCLQTMVIVVSTRIYIRKQSGRQTQIYTQCKCNNKKSMPRFIALIWSFCWFHWNSPTILLLCLWWQVWIWLLTLILVLIFVFFIVPFNSIHLFCSWVYCSFAVFIYLIFFCFAWILMIHFRFSYKFTL